LIPDTFFWVGGSAGRLASEFVGGLRAEEGRLVSQLEQNGVGGQTAQVVQGEGGRARGRAGGIPGCRGGIFRGRGSGGSGWQAARSSARAISSAGSATGRVSNLASLVLAFIGYKILSD